MGRRAAVTHEELTERATDHAVDEEVDGRVDRHQNDARLTEVTTNRFHTATRFQVQLYTINTHTYEQRRHYALHSSELNACLSDVGCVCVCVWADRAR